jgi:hypothetical protein
MNPTILCLDKKLHEATKVDAAALCIRFACNI